MTEIASERMGSSHAQALKSTLREVREFLQLATELLEKDAGAHPSSPALPPERARRVRERIALLDRLAARLWERFGFVDDPPNIRGILRGYSAKVWSDLIDAQSGPMRRYSPPPSGYAETVDPLLEEMANISHEILYLSREPESKE